MTATSRTVPISFVQAGATIAARQGLDVSAWLKAAGIPQLLTKDSRSRITTEQATCLVQELWRMTDDELFGLGPQPLPRGSFRLVALALIHSPDLRTAVERLAEFSTVIPGMPQISILPAGPTTRIEVDARQLDDQGHLITAFVLAFGHRFLAWSVGRRIRLEHVEFPFPAPANSTDYDIVFNAPLRYRSKAAALTFDSRVLDAPLVQNEATLAAYIRSAPAEVLSPREHGMSIVDRVRRLLERGLQSGEWPPPEAIAAHLAMSPQTVRRRLQAESTSITAIKEELMRDAAIAGLVHGNQSMAELAADLGFSESSAFQRAFRRWTGTPPGAYRQMNH